MRPLAAIVALAAASVGLVAEPAGEIRLVDVTERSGIAFVHQNAPTTQKYLVETMGGGVALFDYDGDGKLDVFFTNGAALKDPMPAAAAADKRDARSWNRLYRGNGDGTFTDVTARAGVAGVGYSMGVAVGDYDNDGRADLYVTGVGANQLLRNQGDGKFVDVTAKAGVAASGWSTSATWVDVEGDGRLDLFVCRYVDFSYAENPYCGDKRPGYREYCHPRSFRPVSNVLFHNNGDGSFSDVSATAGISRLLGKSLGVAIGDADGDGRIDVFVANDAVAGFLLRNDGHGAFKDVALTAGVAYNAEGRAVAGMGADLADYDNDGALDLVVTTLSGETYSLYRNGGRGAFEYVTQTAGFAAPSFAWSGWGARLVDLDNDGRKDFFAAQGHVLDTIELTSDHIKYAQPPLLLRGGPSGFSASGAQAPTAAWAGRGVAFGDIDNDGDVDVLVATCGQPPHVLRNDSTPPRASLSISLLGTLSNRDGIGARVTVEADGRAQTSVVTTGSSYLSSSDRRLVVGLGSASSASRVTVRWPSGRTQTLTDVPKGSITITESAG